MLPVVVLLGACSGPSETTENQGRAQAPAPAGEEAQRRVSIAEYETFDASEYPVRVPKQTVEVSHAVPRRLMAGRADEGVKQTVEGYRVQVFSAQDQEAAQKFREKVRQWWERNKDKAPADLFANETPIVIEYSQPYYRVRIGAFASREDASDALEFIRKAYQEAFVAQSTVTVVR